MATATTPPYDITSLQYPSDLSSNPIYNNQKVVFFINVDSNSKLNASRSAGSTTKVPENDDLNNGVITDVGTLPNSTKFVGIRTERLLKAIVLYIPNDLNSSYSTTWSEEDFSQNGLARANEVMGAGAAGFNAGSGAASSVGGAIGGVASAGASIAKSIMMRTAGSPLEKAIGLTPGNAKAEQLFHAVDFRTFTFSYMFAPKNAIEAKTVLDIIQTFKHHMLPEYQDQSKYLFIYPSEFNVKYYFGSEENPYLDKHFTAALTNVSTNYTPNGQYVTFSNGMPAQIGMTLQFKELALPTKESVPAPV